METTDWILLSVSLASLPIAYIYTHHYDVYSFLYNYSGVRAIFEKIHPPTEEQQQDYNFRKPSTFVLWAISIYVALFSIASARYDRAVNSYDMQISGFQTQMATTSRANACANLRLLQKVRVPVKPDFFVFWKTFYSFYRTEKYELGQKMLLQTIKAYKKELYQANLNGADLSGINLSRANLNSADLRGTNLSNAILARAELKNIMLLGANLEGANLNAANLTGAILIRSDLKNATLIGAILNNANLIGANLSNATIHAGHFNGTILLGTTVTNTEFTWANLKNAIFDSESFSPASGEISLFFKKYFKNTELSKSKNLYEAKLPSKIRRKLMKSSPHLFARPEWFIP
ncbi:pentapeptide repeat-containing protein [Maridesulfovibrio zosterae]|uniref:pentapeptide repeat-containing protein n=1 Tax=Maridesulfovibrio zosterae TaxID=82171 RepID=UPI0003FF680C|nr:pentapeptide repeat-containing protein [Maridesulfovibrio zosterae]